MTQSPEGLQEPVLRALIRVALKRAWLEGAADRMAAHEAGEIWDNDRRWAESNAASATLPQQAATDDMFPNSRKSRDSFIDAIREAAPNGEEVAVRYHANNDWSVANAPLSALTREGEELRHKFWMVICHASGGRLSKPEDVDRSINDICVQITRKVNDAYEAGKLAALSTPTSQPPAAETRLAAVIELCAKVADEYAFQARSEAANGRPRDAELQAGYIANAIRALTQPEPTAQQGSEVFGYGADGEPMRRFKGAAQVLSEALSSQQAAGEAEDGSEKADFAEFYDLPIENLYTTPPIETQRIVAWLRGHKHGAPLTIASQLADAIEAGEHLAGEGQ